MTLKQLKNKLSLIKNIINYFIGIIYPYRCPSCRRIVNNNSFCESCWKKLFFIEKPYCVICGEQLNVKTDSDLICGKCIKFKYNFDRNFSVFIYNRTIAKAIYKFKFGRKTFLAEFFAKFLAKKTNNVKIDYLIAVPIHKKRLKTRGYNQSLLLVKEVSKITNIPYISNLLLKDKNTVPQSKLKSSKRKTNLKSVFNINKKYIENIKGKNIGIIDDVFTTGSTINECAKILKKSGANKVFGFTIVKSTLNKDIRKRFL